VDELLLIKDKVTEEHKLVDEWTGRQICKVFSNISKRIIKDILSKAQTVVELSDGNKATIYCNNGLLQKIEFDFMTLSKVQTGKYKVQLTKNTTHQMPEALSFGFTVPDGISTIAITFR
jgi:conserved domain protein